MFTRALSEAYVHLANRLDTGASHHNRAGGWYAALRRHERVLWIVVGAALLGDAVSTVAGINYGLTEGNPFVAVALATGGLGGFLAVKVAALAAAGVCRRVFPDAGPAIALGLAIPWTVASVANAATLATLA